MGIQCKRRRIKNGGMKKNETIVKDAMGERKIDLIKTKISGLF